jgi:hypothetical protein
MGFEMSKRKWCGLSNDIPSISVLKEIYPSEDGYSVSENRQPADAHFRQSMSLLTIVFVLYGSITSEVGADVLCLSAHDFGEVPCGSYMCTTGKEGVRFVHVMQLPEQYRRLSRPVNQISGATSYPIRAS